MIQPMKDKFTDRAKQVLHLAQSEARYFGRNVVAPEHILLALIAEKSVASQILQHLTIEVNEARHVIEESTGRGNQSFPGELPLSEAVQQAIELAIHEMQQLQHSYVGPEHLLSGLLHIHNSTIIRVLQHFKTTSDEVQQRITALFNGSLFQIYQQARENTFLTEADAWKGIEHRYQPHQIVNGTITKIMPFGAFVTLEQGVEGLLHISELPIEMDIKRDFSEGQVLQLHILSIDAERHRLGLSLR